MKLLTIVSVSILSLSLVPQVFGSTWVEQNNPESYRAFMEKEIIPLIQEYSGKLYLIDQILHIWKEEVCKE